MERHTFLTIVQNSQAEKVRLLEKKGKAYSGTDDTFANFKRNAVNLGLTKYQVWAVYAFKHIDSIANAIKFDPKQPVDNSEGLADRINDAQNYLDLLRGMLIEDGLIQPPPNQVVVATKFENESRRDR